MTKIQSAEVIRHDGPLMLPEKMSYDNALEVLTRLKEQDEKVVMIHEDVPAFVWDGALALSKALTEQFGFVMQQETWGFFGPQPPKQIAVAISPTETVKVPWGEFSLPGVTDGRVGTQMMPNGNFGLYAKIKGKYRPMIDKLFKRVAEICRAESIYKNQAFSVAWDDNNENDHVPTIKFLELNSQPAIFNRSLEHAIETNILTPIRYSKAARKAGIPMKRGILIAGAYGTGKTMTAAHIAKVATTNNWTFIYVQKIDDLPQALEFGRRFQPCIMFGEDIERLAGTDRTNSVNTLLNTLDGINSKATEIMTILTSNHAEQINEAMRRPGRIDVILPAEMPNCDTVQRLIRLYGPQKIEGDLTEVGNMLAGQRPAVIRETVERAKLEMIGRTAGANDDTMMSEDLESAANVLLVEQALFRTVPVADGVPQKFVDHLVGSVTAETVSRIKKHIDSKF